jgi:hypothetical protein
MSASVVGRKYPASLGAARWGADLRNGHYRLIRQRQSFKPGRSYLKFLGRFCEQFPRLLGEPTVQKCFMV